jgi:GAF domain
MDLGADPVARARLLRRAHERVLSGAPAPAIVREVVTRSWERCAQAGIDPDRHDPPVVLGPREAAMHWRDHPLAGCAPLVERLLCDFAYDARHIVVMSDADGCLLWSAGHAGVLEASAGIRFVPGTLWHESAAGTNGVGTALALDHAVQIFSAEHYNREVHPWTCSGAPVHDPETGRILGVIDLSSGLRASHPHSLALVTAAAASVEMHLREVLAARNERLHARYLQRISGRERTPSALVTTSGEVLACAPGGWLAPGLELTDSPGEVCLPDGTSLVVEPLGEDGSIVWLARAGDEGVAGELALALHGLGRERATAVLADVPLSLSPRAGELLVLLALRPEGLHAEELASELYGDAAKRMSARAEVSRLRRVIGGRLAANPYRLRGELAADFLEVASLLAEGRRDEARERYRGPLLPGARAPTIRAERERLERLLG